MTFFKYRKKKKKKFRIWQNPQIKTFSDKGKPVEMFISKRTLKKWLKEVLEMERIKEVILEHQEGRKNQKSKNRVNTTDIAALFKVAKSRLVVKAKSRTLSMYVLDVENIF